MRTVIPVFAKVRCAGYFTPTFDVVEFWPLLILYLASLQLYNVELTFMPEFTPTEWMLDNHRGKSEHDWEVFAECVREAMGRQSGYRLDNRSNREKLAYESFMCK